MRTSRPVVLAGAANALPAVGLWTFEHFVDRHGDLPLAVQHFRDRRRLADVEVHEMRLRDYVARVRSDTETGLHFSGHRPFVREPSLLREVGIPGLIERLLDEQPWLFLSPREAVTPLHHDLCHNLYVQLSGRKRFVLFAPDQRRFLHAPSRLSRNYWTSPVDVDAPDEPSTPRARHATPAACELEPGDMLFIPSGYWHSVRTLEESVAVAYFWEPGLAYRMLRAGLRFIGRPAT